MSAIAIASCSLPSTSSAIAARIQATSAPAQNDGPSPARTTARRSRPVLAGEARERRPQFGDERRIEGVVGLGAGERHPGDDAARTRALETDVGTHPGILPPRALRSDRCHPYRVAIVGAGLTGPLLAIFLARRGHQVTLYERRPDPRGADADAGRSINLALSARGIDALERAGLADAVLARALPMRGRILHDTAGNLAFQAYSADGKRAINSVSRAGLKSPAGRGRRGGAHGRVSLRPPPDRARP